MRALMAQTAAMVSSFWFENNENQVRLGAKLARLIVFLTGLAALLLTSFVGVNPLLALLVTIGVGLVAVSTSCGKALRFIDTQGQAYKDLEGERAAMQAERDALRAASDERDREVSAIYAHSSFGLGLLDRDLRFRRVNSVLADMNGLSVEDHLGRHAWDLLPGLRETAEPHFRKVLETGQPISGLLIKGDTPKRPGVIREWTETFYPVVSDTGVVIGVGVIVEEITRQVDSERALAAQTSRLERLLGSNVVGLITIDRDIIIEANDAFLGLLGYSRTDINERLNWRQITVPSFSDADARAMEELEQKGFCTPFEKQFYSRNGETVPVLLGAVEIEPEPHPRYVAFVIDMTERRRAEEAVRKSSELLRHVLENVYVFVAMLSLEGRVIETNHGPLTSAGITRDDLMNRPLWETDIWSWSEAVSAQVRAAHGQALNGKIVRLDVPTLARNGVLMTMDLQLAPLLSDDGTITHVIASATDVTERKRREDHILTLMRELTHRTNNMLANVAAMARQTAMQSTNLTDFDGRFAGRLHSLAITQALIVAQDWEGVRLVDLVNLQTDATTDEDLHRVLAEGPDVLLTPGAAEQLGLALHELVANARRHGALTVSEGHISIRWHIEEAADGPRRLRFSWTEFLGTASAKPDAERGYGRMVLERIVPRALQARVDYKVGVDTVTWSVDIPDSVLAKERRPSQSN
jgi:PAS domain S-box-containing protein